MTACTATRFDPSPLLGATLLMMPFAVSSVEAACTQAEQAAQFRTFRNTSQFHSSASVYESVSERELKVPTVAFVSSEVNSIAVAAANFGKEQAAKSLCLSVLRSFCDVEANWDGEDALAPKPQAVADAIAIAKQWPHSLPLPEPDYDHLGFVTLDLFDDDGFSIGGVVLTGKDGWGSYSIVDRSKILTVGKVDTKSQTSIIQMLSDFSRFLT